MRRTGISRQNIDQRGENDRAIEVAKDKDLSEEEIEKNASIDRAVASLGDILKVDINTLEPEKRAELSDALRNAVSELGGMSPEQLIDMLSSYGKSDKEISKEKLDAEERVMAEEDSSSQADDVSEQIDETFEPEEVAGETSAESEDDDTNEVLGEFMPDEETIRRRERLGEQIKQVDFKNRLENVTKAFEDGDIDRAATILNELIEEVKEKGADNISDDELKMLLDVNEKVKKAKEAKSPEEKSKWVKIASAGCDFIPVLGPIKMIYEAARGTTFGGEKLSGKKRILHMTEGIVFGLVDLTGAGVLLTKLGKGGRLAGRLVTRAGAFLRFKGLPKQGKAVYKVGRAIIRHPKIDRAATRFISKAIKARKVKKVRVVKDAVFEGAKEVAKKKRANMSEEA